MAIDAYSKTTYVDGTTPALSAANLNNAEDQIDDITTALKTPTVWTPGIAFGGASVGMTFSTQTGYYFKIGNLVYVSGRLVLTAKGSSTGAATITALPFTVYNNSANYGEIMLRFYNISFTGQFQGYCTLNATTITLENITEAGSMSVLTDANFSDTSRISFSGLYYTAV